MHELRKPEDEKVDRTMLGCLRLSVTTNAAPLKVDPLTPVLREWLAIPAEQRTPEQQRELFGAFRLADTSFAYE